MAFIRLDAGSGAAACEDIELRIVSPDDNAAPSVDAAADASQAPAVTALALENDVDVRGLAGRLGGVDAIILNFPAFTDGRAYSQARVLREQLGFSGDIIAKGDIGRDQALFMARVGVTVVEADDAALEGIVDAVREFSCFYQGAADDAEPVWRLRARAAGKSPRRAVAA